MSHPDSRSSRLSSASARAPALVAALAALVVYACTLRGTYIYDDVAIVRDDPRVLSPSQWGRLWTQPYFVVSVDKLYRPLTSMSFALEHLLHGNRPWIFHLVNILLHMGVAAATAVLGVRLGGSAVGWIAGVLFAVHPVHVEAVAGLVGRAESACALASVVGIVLFLRDGPLTNRRIAALWLCFLVALLTKEQGILFPALLLFAWPLRPPSADRAKLKHLALLFCWTLAAYFVVRERVASFSWDRSRLDWSVNPMILSVGRDRLLMPIVLLGRYTALLVWPRRLSIDYGGPIIGSHASLYDPYLYLGAAALALWFGIAAIAWRKRDRAMLFCLGALALTYGMIGNIIALIGTIFADRLMYLPSVFFLLIVGLLLSRLRRGIVIPTVIALTLLGAARSIAYARLWNDPVQLYSRTVAQEPASERAYTLLFNAYKDRDDWPDADRVARSACEHVPERWEPYVLCIESDLADDNYRRAFADADAGLSRLPRNDKEARLVLLQWKGIIERKQSDASTQPAEVTTNRSSN